MWATKPSRSSLRAWPIPNRYSCIDHNAVRRYPLLLRWHSQRQDRTRIVHARFEFYTGGRPPLTVDTVPQGVRLQLPSSSGRPGKRPRRKVLTLTQKYDLGSNACELGYQSLTLCSAMQSIMESIMDEPCIVRRIVRRIARIAA